MGSSGSSTQFACPRQRCSTSVTETAPYFCCMKPWRPVSQNGVKALQITRKRSGLTAPTPLAMRSSSSAFSDSRKSTASWVPHISRSASSTPPKHSADIGVGTWALRSSISRASSVRR